jgi:AcrR family transcriptional regulator
MNMPLTRGHKKWARTLEDLLSAANRVFSRKDAILATFAEVADEARVASGTIHNYFKSKDELIQAAGQKLLERLQQPVSALIEQTSDPAEQLAIVIKSVLSLTARDPEWGAALVRLVAACERTSSRLTTFIPDLVARGRQQGRFLIADVDAAYVVLSGSVIMAMRNITAREAAPAIAQSISEMLLISLGVGQGEARDIAARARFVDPS